MRRKYASTNWSATYSGADLSVHPASQGAPKARPLRRPWPPRRTPPCRPRRPRMPPTLTWLLPGVKKPARLGQPEPRLSPGASQKPWNRDGSRDRNRLRTVRHVQSDEHPILPRLRARSLAFRRQNRGLLPRISSTSIPSGTKLAKMSMGPPGGRSAAGESAENSTQPAPRMTETRARSTSPSGVTAQGRFRRSPHISEGSLVESPYAHLSQEELMEQARNYVCKTCSTPVPHGPQVLRTLR